MTSREVVDEVQSQIGLDAYHIYPDARRLIPEAVMWGVASACVIEFVKGLVDFKALGQDAGNKLGELLQRWRNKDEFERFVGTERIDVFVYQALDAMPEHVSEQAVIEASENLRQALIEFGLTHGEARQQSDKISEIILRLPGL